MEFVWVWLLVASIIIAHETRACQVHQSMSRSLRLLGADFVFKGEDLEHFNVTEDGVLVTKARFAVHCVFKPSAQVRNVSSEIIIREVENRNCSQTYIRPGDVIVIGLKETRCVSAPGGDCDFELHEVNAPQSAAFSVSRSLMIDISRTCEFEKYHPPQYCRGEMKQDLCPSRFTGKCHSISRGSNLGHGHFTWLYVLLVVMFCFDFAMK